MANKTLYLTHVDLWDYDGNLLAEPETATDKIPSMSVGWLLEQGLIEFYVAPIEGQEGE